MSDLETKNEKDIALIQKDIGYIKKDTAEIKDTLKLVLDRYAQKDDVESRFNRMEDEIDGRIKGIHERLHEKLDKEDFEPVKKIGLTVILAVVVAMLAVIGLK